VDKDCLAEDSRSTCKIAGSYIASIRGKTGQISGGLTLSGCL